MKLVLKQFHISLISGPQMENQTSQKQKYELRIEKGKYLQTGHLDSLLDGIHGNKSPVLAYTLPLHSILTIPPS